MFHTWWPFTSTEDNTIRSFFNSIQALELVNTAAGTWCPAMSQNLRPTSRRMGCLRRHSTTLSRRWIAVVLCSMSFATKARWMMRIPPISHLSSISHHEQAPAQELSWEQTHLQVHRKNIDRWPTTLTSFFFFSKVEVTQMKEARTSNVLVWRQKPMHKPNLCTMPYVAISPMFSTSCSKYESFRARS